MPKWYNNTLLIIGPPDAIEAFRASVRPRTKQRPARATTLSLRSLSPCEPTYRRQLAQWGTPWDVRARMTEDEATGLKYKFRSAVGPPLAWLKSASKQYPTLDFSLRYEGKYAFTLGGARFIGGVGDDVRNEPGRFFFLRKFGRTQL